MYGMHKTTLYLPEDLKEALDRVASAEGRSVAEVIREAVRARLENSATPAPRVPLFRSGKPDLAERVDELLAGFGEA